jgi:hypothetical protein
MLHTGHSYRKEDQGRGKYTDTYCRTRQYGYCTSGECLFKPYPVESFFLVFHVSNTARYCAWCQVVMFLGYLFIQSSDSDLN